ncbi:MAG: 30S ribosomal protein S8e [Candidatus Diapherotrites archaeon]|nr:30S ribosomal protein S8e [Candidatus Diapherotrites archaeon]
MTQWHLKSKTKSTGAKITKSCKKRLSQIGNIPTEVTVGESKSKTIKNKGGSTKVRFSAIDSANITVEPGKIQKTKILKVSENNANRHYSRRNIITKGAVIETELGKAIVTSRPAQDMVINAKLIKE